MDNESSFERHKKSVGDIGIGELCTPDAKRDAIHFACAPVEAGHSLNPGEHVNMLDGLAHACSARHAIGIVDPFLTEAVHAGQRFWLILNPGSITAMRHAWEHPAFGDEQAAGDKAKSQQWLRQFSEDRGHDYDDVMGAARYAQETGRGVLGNDPGIYNIPPDFWDHFEAVTGVKAGKRPDYFSCAC